MSAELSFLLKLKPCAQPETREFPRYLYEIFIVEFPLDFDIFMAFAVP